MFHFQTTNRSHNAIKIMKTDKRLKVSIIVYNITKRSIFLWFPLICIYFANKLKIPDFPFRFSANYIIREIS